jgi:dihydroflavonol-4-reductase
MIFVTGASGFLGKHVVAALGGGAEIVTFGRANTPALRDHGVTFIEGDVVTTPVDTLAAAMRNCDTVYHLAGFVSRDDRDGQRMMRVHIEGTRNVVHAAKAAGVRRVLIASTSGTIAIAKTPVAVAEDAPYPLELVGGWPYYLSKIYQERLALELGRTLGIEIVVVNPSLLLGPGDERQSSTTDVKKFLKREVPGVPPGGLSFVDARDAAVGCVTAMARGRVGERYLLGGPNWTFSEFFGRLERVSKVDAPKLRLPKAFALPAARFLESAFAVFDKESPIDRASVEMGQYFWYCDCTKARTELDFTTRDPSETLDDTVRELRERFL